MRILLKVLYWLAVLAISVALVIGLILWFESQDASEIEGSGLPEIRSA
jgi:cytochrome b subunit of formate dehydrogenase